MKDKTAYTKKIIDKLNKIADREIEKGDYDLALNSIALSADILYKYNQYYTDDDLESMLQRISEKMVKPKYFSNYSQISNNTIVFYDGFGVDRRGIAIIMCKAILENDYKLIYVSPIENKDKQPALFKELRGKDVVFEYYERDGSFISRVDSLSQVFLKHYPKLAFFYTTPSDVSGCCVFNALEGLVFRYQIDLTDHAFWLGVNAFDMCNGGRPFSASIQHYYRRIPKEKLTMLDASLFVDDCEFQGLPFDESNRFVFSGGQLYKTLGDENNTYYKIVDHILDNHPDVLFLYAGSGDDTKLREVSERYPHRVFHLNERPDFYQIIQKCTIYLNTYPMFGGLMMRYAALAGKLPITLKHDNDSDGILIDQETRGIEYCNYEELIEDLDKLLDDEQYLHKREEKLIGSVVTDECFVRNIRLMIEEHRTEFPISKIEKVNTEEFRKEFFDRFKYKDIYFSIAKRRNHRLFRYFPIEYSKGVYYKIFDKIKRRLAK